MSQTDTHNPLQRVIFGGIGIFFVITLLYFSNTPWGRYLFFGVVSATIVTSLLEFYKMTTAKGHQPITWLGVISSIALLCFNTIEDRNHFHSYVGVLLAMLFLSYLIFFAKGNNPLTNLSITLFGFCYLAIPLSFILLINNYRHSPSTDTGSVWLLYLLVVTKMTDIFGYIIGKNWGKHLLAPMISPKKTVEGAAGGFLFAVLSSVCFYVYFHHFTPSRSMQLNLFQSLWLGSLVSILAQIGDLAESLLKRDAGVKDSSSLPGLGGMLDIVDSLIFTTPAVYYYLSFHSGTAT